MKTQRLFACMVATSMSLIACASKESSEPPLTPASGETPSWPDVPAEDENERIEPRQCISSDDCGPGYVCGFDHSESHVVRHCLAE